MWNPFRAAANKVENAAASSLADVFSMFITKIGRMTVRAICGGLEEFDPDRAAEYQASASALKK